MNSVISPAESSISYTRELWFAAAAMAVVTGLSLLLVPVTGHVAVALLYLMLIVLVGLNFTRRTVLLVAGASAVLWNFLFIPPRFTFYIEKLEDILLFAMFFVIAFAMCHITNRLRDSQFAQRQRERRTAALYELVRQAGLAPELDAGLAAALTLVETTFAVKAALLRRRKDHTLSREPYPEGSFHIGARELELAQAAFAEQRPVGKFTETSPDAMMAHLPLKGRIAVMGVLTLLPPNEKVLGAAEMELLESFAVLIGTILERDHLLAAFRHAEILEASERLHRALFNSVSHELKTPLAAAQTGVDALTSGAANDDQRRIALGEIHSALRRLNRVINNLLDMTRIESGVVRPKLDWCDVNELIEKSVELTGDTIDEHRMIVHVEPNFPMVKLDQALIEQCLGNLLLNAAGWSPAGSEIAITARLQGNELLLSVQDEGEGIPAAELNRIFDSFYRSSTAKPGGTGLGLSIVDGFVRAHGGKVHAANREPHGAEFVITIPVETLPQNLLEKFA